MSKLRELLQDEASADLNRILAEADSRAERIIRDAEAEASFRVAGHQKKTEAAARAAARRGQSASELTVSTARMRARGQVIELLREKSLIALEQTAFAADFDRILRALAEEAVAAIAEGEAVVVHPNDRERINGWAKDKGLKVQTDSKIRLGVRIVSRSGKTVENTLPGRLHRAWDTLVTRVVQLLWE